MQFMTFFIARYRVFKSIILIRNATICSHFLISLLQQTKGGKKSTRMDIKLKSICTIQEVVLDDCRIGLDDFMAVVRSGAKLIFSDNFKEKVKLGRDLINKFLNENRAVYGVTTGFGENVRYRINTEDAVELQKRIVRSHSVAVGRPLEKEQTRAIMLQTILNAGKGHTGLQLSTLEVIRQYLNQDIYPFAPGEGSVGYLAVEGHFVMAYIGEGYVFENSVKVPSLEVMQKKRIKPVELQCKEGLSMLNGTISVTALSMIALYDAIIALKNVEVVGGLCYEALRGTVKALDPRIHANKNHLEQIYAAQNLKRLLKGSEISEKYIDSKVQDSYILRTMPHIHGAAKRLVKESYEVIMDEMYGVSDNPEIFPTENGDGIALMSGNFDGTFVGSHADMISMAMAIAGKQVERSISRLVDHNLNDGLPAFLIENAGLNNGFMIPQYTAAALESEIKILAQPSSIDSIPTCASQEDPVSMAYFAAKKAGECVRKLEYIIAIGYFTTLQAIDLLNPLSPSPVNQKIKQFVRKKVHYVDQDRYFYPDVEYLFALVKDGVLVNLAEEEIGELNF